MAQSYELPTLAPIPTEPAALERYETASKPKHPIAIGVGMFLILGIIAALVLVREVFLLGFFAVLIATLMSFPVRLISKLLPRGVAVVVTLLLMGGATLGIVLLAVPTISTQFGELQKQLPEAAQRANDWVNGLGQRGAVSNLPQRNRIANSVKERASKTVGEVAAKIVPAAAALVSGIATMVLVIILAAFLVVSPENYRRGIRTLIPQRFEERFDETWKRLGHTLRHWMGGILVSMSIMGGLTALGLKLIGIQAWFLLGVLTFFGTFIPYVGALSSAVPGLLLGLAQGPRQFLFTCALYLGVHIVEGYFVQPVVMKRAVEIRPAALLFWQALAGALFGLMGIIVATPLLAALKISVEYLYVEQTLHKTPVSS